MGSPHSAVLRGYSWESVSEVIPVSFWGTICSIKDWIIEPYVSANKASALPYILSIQSPISFSDILRTGKILSRSVFLNDFFYHDPFPNLFPSCAPYPTSWTIVSCHGFHFLIFHLWPHGNILGGHRRLYSPWLRNTNPEWCEVTKTINSV